LETRWDIFFTNQEIPTTHAWTPDTAFFISQSCPGNFHHFWTDEFISLFSVMNISNRLHLKARNHVLYRTPTDLVDSEAACDDIHRYEAFLKYINVVEPHEVFYKLPANTCFRNAVFGLANLNYDSRLVVDYVLSKAGLPSSSCDDSVRVLIIQRKRRRLINAAELLEAAISEGFSHSVVVDFEEKTVEEQMSLCACSQVMLGVQGAGLQWAVFMQRGSTLVEVAWPQKFWGFYFNSFVSPYGIRHRTLTTDLVHVNWPAYQDMVQGGEVVAEEERQDLLHSRPQNTINNIWKWADALVEVDKFVEILRSVKSNQ
jgi:adenomatosis polyposis coli protein